MQFGFTKDTDALDGELSFSPSGGRGCIVKESLSTWGVSRMDRTLCYERKDSGSIPGRPTTFHMY